MQSLDDLELERESGGIDDESYAALHDDYTGTRRGDDPRIARRRRRATARDAKAPPGQATGRGRRARSSCSRSSPASRSPAAVGVRLPGQTSSGNSPNVVGRGRRRQADQVAAEAGERESRRLRPPPRARRRVREQQRPPQRDQAVGRGDHDRSEPSRGPRAARTSALPRVGAGRPTRTAQAQLVASARAGVRQGHRGRPRLSATRTSSAACCSLSIGDSSRARRPISRRTCARSPNGTWRTQAVDLLAQVTTALASTSTTVPASP